MVGLPGIFPGLAGSRHFCIAERRSLASVASSMSLSWSCSSPSSAIAEGGLRHLAAL